MATLTTIIDASGATAGAREFQQATSTIEEGAKRADVAIAGVDSRIAGIPSVVNLARQALGGLFAVLSIGAAVREISAFEDSIARIGAVTGATEEELTALGDTVRSIASTGRASVGELNAGVLELVRSERSLTEATLILDASTKAAAGSQGNLSSIVDQTDKVLKLFGRSAADAAKTLDTVSLVSSKSGASVENLLGGLQFFAPTARQVRASLEEVTAVFGVLDDRFVNSRQSALAMQSVINDLVNPSKEASAAIHGLGITLADVDPQRVGLVQAILNLADANLSAADAARIFTGRGKDAVNLLIAQKEELRELVTQTESATGASERLASAEDGTLGGSIRGLIGSVTALITKVGPGGVIGALTSFLKLVTDGVKVIGGFDDTIQGTAATAEATARVLSGGAAFLTTSKAIALVTSGLGSLKVALLTNPITLIPTLLAAGIGALVAFKDELVSVGGRLASVGDVAAAAFGAIGDRAQIVFQFVASFAKDALTRLIDLFSGAFEAIGDIFVGFADQVLPGWEELFTSDDGFLGAVKDLFNASIAIFKTLGDALDSLIDATLQAFANLATFDFSSPFESIKRIAAQTFADFGSIVDESIEQGRQNFETDYVSALLDLGERGAEALVSGFEGKSGAEALAAFLDFGGDVNERLAASAGARVAKAYLESAKLTLVGSFAGIPLLLPLPGAAAGTQGSSATETPPPVVSPEEPEIVSRANQDLERRIELLTVQNELTRQGVDASGDAVELYELEREAIANNDAALLSLIERLRASQEEARKLAEEQAKLQQAQDFLTGAFTEATASIIEGTQSISDAVENLVKDLLAQFLRLALSQGFQALFGNAQGGQQGVGIFAQFASAFAGAGSRGAIVDANSRVVPFQRGGVISGPMAFPLAGNRFGLAGEAGDEGILPLRRDSSGRLGVSAEGSGTRSITVVQNINTPDANSFRKSKRQIEQDLSSSVRRFE